MSLAAAVREPAAPEARAAPADVVLRLDGVRKHFKGAAAVERVDLAVRRGEFFTLLGPSGSGKTTTLRLVAGFERPDAGRIELDGVDDRGVEEEGVFHCAVLAVRPRFVARARLLRTCSA